MTDSYVASASFRPERTSDAQIAALVKHLRVMGFIMPAVMKAAGLIEELHRRAAEAEDLCDAMDKAQSAMFDSLENAVAKMHSERDRCAAIVDEHLGDGEGVRFTLHAIRSGRPAGLSLSGQIKWDIESGAFDVRSATDEDRERHGIERAILADANSKKDFP